MGYKVIITGATGMVGEGVVHECLQHHDISTVLVINRRSCGIQHSKLKEILHADFFDLSPVRMQLTGYDACFFCLGVSSVGMKEAEYRRLTYDLTLHAATVLSEANRGMLFCYVSGAGTDSSEKGRSMWARVKGKTENDIRKLPFRRTYMYRPGFIRPTKGLKNSLSFYKYINWLFPLLRPLSPKYFVTLKELGLSMIHLLKEDYPKQIIDGKDIIDLAKREAVTV